MVRPATQDDLTAILAIYNDAVLDSTAIWNDRVVDWENRRAWLLDRQSRNRLDSNASFRLKVCPQEQ
jgi:L-amino acid N-acyltransferase